MKRLPDLLFIVDVGREDTAVHEANLLNIPIVALVDTNCNPQDIDYVIPSNDDAIRAIKLLVAKVADAVLEGKAMRKDERPWRKKPPSRRRPMPRSHAPTPPASAKRCQSTDDEVGEDSPARRSPRWPS